MMENRWETNVPLRRGVGQHTISVYVHTLDSFISGFSPQSRDMKTCLFSRVGKNISHVRRNSLMLTLHKPRPLPIPTNHQQVLVPEPELREKLTETGCLPVLDESEDGRVPSQQASAEGTMTSGCRAQTFQQLMFPQKHESSSLGQTVP